MSLKAVEKTSQNGAVKLEKALNENIETVTEVSESQDSNSKHIGITASTLQVDENSDANFDFSFDYIAVLSFIITAFVVWISTRQSTKQSLKIVESQEKLSRDSARENVSLKQKELTAANRQAWINTLRKDLAAFIAAANTIYELHRIKSGRASVLANIGKPEYAMKELLEWSVAYNKAVQQTEELCAKIKLLINPVENKSIQLIKLLDDTMKCAKSEKSADEITNEIIEVSQKILKEEWERVKNLT